MGSSHLKRTFLCIIMALHSVITGLFADTITGVFNGYIAVMALSWMAISLWMSCTCCCILLPLDDNEYDDDGCEMVYMPLSRT